MTPLERCLGKVSKLLNKDESALLIKEAAAYQKGGNTVLDAARNATNVAIADTKQFYDSMLAATRISAPEAVTALEAYWENGTLEVGDLPKNLHPLAEALSSANITQEAEISQKLGESSSSWAKPIAEWIKSKLIVPITEPKAAATKSKARRSIDTPARRAAYELLRSGDLVAIDKIIGSKITAPPAGMIKIIKGLMKSGKATEKQREIVKKWDGFDSYQPKNAFGTDFNGKVAQELHGMLFSQSKESTAIDDWAGLLGDVTNDEAMIAVMSELDQVSKGKIAKEDDSNNPNRDFNDDEIAKELAKRESAEMPAEDRIKEMQDEGFDQAKFQGPKEGDTPISADEMVVGQKITVDGEPMTVTQVVTKQDFMGNKEVDYVVLQDGTRFGRQVLEGGEVIYEERESDESPVDQGFNLETQTDEQIKAEEAAAKAKAELQKRQDKRLTGSAGDLTADMFGGGETPLFNENRSTAKVEAAPEQAEDVSPAEIKSAPAEERKEEVKKMGGYYSSYRVGGAIPGFQFKDRATAEQFQAITNGETVDRAEAVQERQAESKNAAAERLNAMADKTEAVAEASLNADRKTNTAKRAREAGTAQASARTLKALAETMRNLASAIESGDVTHLDGVRTKTHVETLELLARRAKSEAERTEDITYAERQKREGEPVTSEQIDKAKYPYPFLNETAFQWLIDNGNNTPGAKRLTARLEKVFAAKPSAKENGSYLTGADMIEAVKELLGKIKKQDYTRTNIEDAFKSYDRVQAMGLKDLPSLRAALREFLQYRGTKAKEDPIKAMERELVGMKIPGFFPTPPAVIERMMEEAGDLRGKRVLEPSAGKGDIVDVATTAGATVDAIEQQSRLRGILEAKGANTIGQDFMEVEPSPEYDAVLMNPPFEDGQDGEHVQRAFQFLKPGGKLVAITGEGIFSRSDKKAKAFRDWLESVDGTSEKLPEGSFKSAFRPTGVATRIVVVTKPADTLRAAPLPKAQNSDTDITIRDAELSYGQPDFNTTDSPRNVFGNYELAPLDSLSNWERSALRNAERATGRGKVGAARISTIQESKLRPAARLASEWFRLFNKRVLFVAPTGEENLDFEGMVHPSDLNTIIIDASSPMGFSYLIGHELGHSIQHQQPELYDDFKSAILAMAPDWAEYNDRLAKVKDYDTQDKRDAEFVNDFIGSQFGEPKFWRKLQEKDASLFRKVLDSALEFFASIGGKIGGLHRDVRPYFADIEAARDELVKTLEEYRKGKMPDSSVRKDLKDSPNGFISTGLRSSELPAASNDKEYLAAVEAGDMETAQRMVDEAAKAAGYDIGFIHGTQADGEFTVFDMDNATAKGTAWFEKRKASDSEYGRKMTVALKLRTPLNLSRAKWYRTKAEWRRTLTDAGIPVGRVIYNPKFDNEGMEVLETLNDTRKRYAIEDILPHSETTGMFVNLRDAMVDAGYDGLILPTERRERYPIKGYLVPRQKGTNSVAFFPNQIKSADPVTRDDQGNVIPLSQRFDSTKDSILRAAPLPANQELEQIKQRGRADFAKIAPKVKEAQTMIDDFGSGSLGVDPKFANFGGVDQNVRNQVDIVRAADMANHEVRKDRDTFAKAKELLAKDSNGVYAMAMEGAYSEGAHLRIDDHQQLAIEILTQKLVKEAYGNPKKLQDAQALIWANILNRKEAGRLLRIGFDKFMTPEERADKQLSEMIFRIHPKVEARAKTMTLAQRKAFFQQAGKNRIKEVEAALKKAHGLRLDQVLRQRNEATSKATKLEKEILKLKNVLDQSVIAQIKKGASLKDIQRLYNVAPEKALAVLKEHREAIASRLRKMLQSGMTEAQIIEAEKDNLKAAPLKGDNNAMTPEQIEAIIARRMEDYKLPTVESLLKQKALPKTPKAKLPKEEIIHPLSTDWSKPRFFDGLNGFEFDRKDRAGIMDRVEKIRMIVGAVGQINLLTGIKQEQAKAALAEINSILSKYGTDAEGILNADKGIESYGFDPTDMVQMAAIARTINQIDADWIDKAMEFLYANMLWGPQTMIVNATASANAVYQMTVGRMVEMSINHFAKDPMSAQFGEVKYILRALKPGLQRATSNFQAAWLAQHPMTERDLLGSEVDWEAHAGGFRNQIKGGVISGKKGDLHRTPLRLLSATDDFNKTLFGMAEAAAFAYRLGVKKSKTKGDKMFGKAPGSPEFERFIKIEMNTPGSFSMRMGVDKASRMIFANALPGQKNSYTGEIEPSNDIGGVIGIGASKLNEFVTSGDHDNIAAKALLAMLRISFFPFQRTPFNIVRQGMRYTPNPISLTDILWGTISNSMQMNEKTGKNQFKWNAGGRVPELIERASMQLQGAAVMGVLMALAVGEGDDDDQDKWLVMTGTSPWSPAKRSQKEARERAGVGAYRISWRTGNGDERAGFSYGRIEPLATALSTTIDTIRTIKRIVRKDGDASDIASNLLGGLVAQTKDKTFMRGFGDLIDLMTNAAAADDVKEPNQRKLNQFIVGKIAMTVPNIIKQPIREADNTFRERSDNFNEELMYQLFPYGQKAAKLDPYGDKMEKQKLTGSEAVDSFARVFDFSDSGKNQVNPVDKMLLKFREKTPEKAWFPAVITNATFEHKSTGKSVKMDGAQLAEFREKAGKLTKAMIKVQRINYENPTEIDVEKVKTAYEKAKSQTKKALSHKFSQTEK